MKSNFFKQHLICIILLGAGLLSSAQNSFLCKGDFYAGVTTFNTFGNGVYTYEPTLSYLIGGDYYWSPHVFTGFTVNTMRNTVVPQWPEFDTYTTQDYSFKLTTGLLYQQQKIIFRPALNAGLGIFYLNEFFLENNYGNPEDGVLYNEDYAYAPMLGLDFDAGYLVLPDFAINFTIGAWYTAQNWDVKATGWDRYYTPTPFYINTTYHYNQSLIIVSAGLKCMYFLR